MHDQAPGVRSRILRPATRGRYSGAHARASAERIEGGAAGSVHRLLVRAGGGGLDALAEREGWVLLDERGLIREQPRRPAQQALLEAEEGRGVALDEEDADRGDEPHDA